jgi:hypothetical protein
MDPVMTPRTFTFRLRSSQAAADRSTASLVVEWLDDAGAWIPQVPSLTTPGFRLYLLSLLLCQHNSLVVNARQRDLHLQRVEGWLEVVSLEWRLQQVRGQFSLTLEPAAVDRADAQTLASIAERMKLCPVSRNLDASVDKCVVLQLDREA